MAADVHFERGEGVRDHALQGAHDQYGLGLLCLLTATGVLVDKKSTRLLPQAASAGFAVMTCGAHHRVRVRGGGPRTRSPTRAWTLALQFRESLMASGGSG